MSNNITFLENLLKDNPQWGIMRKWSLQCHINQLKGVPVPPHPLEVPEYQGNIPINKSRDNKKQSEQKEIKDLKRDVKFWEQTASNHLKNLQLAQGKVINLEEENKKLKNKEKP